MKIKTIEQVSLPTPYPVGRVNCYLIRGNSPILVDTGVRSSRSLDELEAALGSRGLRFDDIGAILLTHRHYDHAGAACELSRRCGAPVMCHRQAVQDEESSRETFLELISRYGAPTETQKQLATMWMMGDVFGEPLNEVDDLHAISGEKPLTVEGVTLQPLHTPGHSLGHLCFLVEELDALICGDLLLAEITSNPLPHFDDEAPRGRYTSLALYLESLERVEALGPFKGLPGHGEDLPDTANAARKARSHILARSEKVLRLLRRWNGLRVFELAEKFFWEDSVMGKALAFCEILAHADLLEDRGRLEVDPDRGVVHLLS